MKIPVDIEPHLLDYLEGNLSGETLERVETFINANPEVLDDLIGLPMLEAPKATMDTSNLIVEDDVEQLMLAALDAPIGDPRLAEVNSLIAASIPLQKEWALCQHTKLTPDSSIVMPSKSDLFKKGVLIPFAAKGFYRAAAAILIVISSSLAYWFMPFSTTTSWYSPNTYSSSEKWEANQVIGIPQKTKTLSTKTEKFTAKQGNLNTKTPVDLEHTEPSPPIEVLPLQSSQNIRLLATTANAPIRIDDISSPSFTLPQEAPTVAEMNSNMYDSGLVAYAVKKVRRKLGLQSKPNATAAIEKNELAYLTEKSISAVTKGHITANLHGNKSLSINSKRLFLELN